MGKENLHEHRNIRSVGTFTKNAIKEFEENIVSKKDYLEEVDKNIKTKIHKE